MAKTTEMKKGPDGLESREGHRWVRAHYKDAEGVERKLRDGEELLETATFEEGEEVRTAWYTVERTIQVRQYEPLKISLGVSLPCRAEEAGAALKKAREIVHEQFNAELAKIKSEVAKLGGR